MSIKYLLCPGYVRSKTDGDAHYITAHKLAELYGVSLQECEIKSDSGFGITYLDNLIPLYPSYSGDYTLPSE